jgi:5'-nucleotidase
MLAAVLAIGIGCLGHIGNALAGTPEGKRFVLTILHNNDGESEIMPTALDSGGSQGGVAYFARVLGDAQREARRLPRGYSPRHARAGGVFVSSGDNFLASPAFTASLEDSVFYDALALDWLGYDAIALGNHDFDFGPELLAEFVDEFRWPGRPPYLSANLDFTGEPDLQALFDAGIIAKSTIVRTRGELIGIVGATTPNLPFISSPRNVEVLQNVADIVQKEVDALEAEGVNKIVLISHLQDVDADKKVIEQLSGVDVAVAGGGDELLANCSTVFDCQDVLVPSDLEDRSGGGPEGEDPDGIPDALAGSYPLEAEDADGNIVPVVTTAGGYKYLGRLVVEFDAAGHLLSVLDSSGPLRVVSRELPGGVRPLNRFERRVVQPVEEFVEELAATVIADSEVDLDGRRSPGVRTMETNEGNLIADSLLWQGRKTAGDFGAPAPDVALQNGGGIRNDSIISKGDITELDTFDMVPFSNFLAVVPDIPRAQFKKILENAVSRTQSGDIPGGTGRFAQVAGFSFEYSADGTAQVIDVDGNIETEGTRVRNVVLDDGTEIVNENGDVVPGDDIVVATIDFLARGGDQYPFNGAPFTVLGVSYQQALSNYIQDPDGLDRFISASDYPEGGESRIVELP